MDVRGDRETKPAITRELAHPVGAQVSGTGITLTTALTQAHTSASQVSGSPSTPGAPNHYYRKPQ